MSSTQSSKPAKRYSRNVAGLRDALFDEIEDLREGHSQPHEAIAFAKLADQVIRTIETDQRRVALHMAHKQERERIAALKPRELPAPDEGQFDEE